MPLTAQRVAEVFNPPAGVVGSGWFVAPHLVLTVWHAAEGSTRDGESAPGRPPPRRPLSPAALDELSRDRPRCRVRALADARAGRPFRDAVTVWWRPESDVAVLLVTEGAHDPAPPAGWSTTYWTDLTAADPVEVTAVGFPNHDVVGRMRESRQFSGVVHPLSGVRSGHWVISTGALARPTSGSGWAGMSGAALFTGDRLAGIVTADASGGSGSVAELRAVPARAFADDPLLAEWIRWAGGTGVWAYRPIERPEPSRPAPADVSRRRHSAAVWISPAALLLGTATAAGVALPWSTPAAATVATAGCAATAVRAWHLRRHTPLLPPELLAAAPPANAVRDRGGLTYHAAEPGELARVYTRQHLDTTADRDARAPAGRDGSAPIVPLRVTGQPVSVERLLTDPTVRHVVVTGEAGVGKSSLLEYVETTAWRWWRAATRGTTPGGAPFGPLLPLRIAARELVGRDSIASAASPSARALLDADPPVPGAQLLVLVDALDEVTRPEDWRQVMEVLLGTARESASGSGMPRRLVLSARSLHDSTWRSLANVGATEFRLQPFTVEQLRRFVMAHQTAGAERLTDPEIHERAAARAAQFLAYVRGNGMLDLVRLPLLARLAVGQYFDSGGEPRAQSRRVDLYARAVAEFLGRFPQRQSPYETPLRDRVEGLLGLLRARYAREAPRHAAVTAALRGFLGDLADTHLRHGTPLTRAATSLLTEPTYEDPYQHRAVAALLEATGLVVDVHTADPRFLHRTFAEYLAAPHLRDRLGTDPATWGDALSDADTRIAALFAFDRQPADRQREIASRLAADPERVEQASWLLAEGMCDDETRGRILDQLWQRPDGPDRDAVPVIRNWRQTHAALAHLAPQQSRLHDMSTDPDSVPVDRINAAAALAGHDPRGTDLLAAYAHDDSFPLQLRIAAAGHLAHVDRDAGTALLTRFADDTASRYCAQAAARLAEHDTPAGTARLRTLVADPHCPDLAKVEAAIELSGHDRATGAEWLRRFAADGRFFADCRVYAADALAASANGDGQARAAATLLLERIARDGRVDAGYRVEAAHRLARYDTDTGIALLRDFADGALPGRYRCDAAVLLAQHDREAGVRTLGEIARAVGGKPEHRLRAAAELAHYAPAEGDARLVALASEPGWDDGPRIQAAVLLARRNREAGLPLLRAYAAELTGEAQVTAASALAGVDREEGLRLLRELAESPDSDRSVRVRAASAIGDFDAQLKDATLRRLGVDIKPGGWFSI
ncbi:trypsin-like peptidase domain-containing protein [Micromonospora sp. DT47]|uniref:trypsin-like peptidase domain-containing protein n=1 Tax=Micromonospora sp. DT47 TaxID=3393431 RepID=UPI003CE7B8E7